MSCPPTPRLGSGHLGSRGVGSGRRRSVSECAAKGGTGSRGTRPEARASASVSANRRLSLPGPSGGAGSRTPTARGPGRAPATSTATPVLPTVVRESQSSRGKARCVSDGLDPSPTSWAPDLGRIETWADGPRASEGREGREGVGSSPVSGPPTRAVRSLYLADAPTRAGPPGSKYGPGTGGQAWEREPPPQRLSRPSDASRDQRRPLGSGEGVGGDTGVGRPFCCLSRLRAWGAGGVGSD